MFWVDFLDQTSVLMVKEVNQNSFSYIIQYHCCTDVLHNTHNIIPQILHSAKTYIFYNQLIVMFHLHGVIYTFIYIYA